MASIQEQTFKASSLASPCPRGDALPVRPLPGPSLFLPLWTCFVLWGSRDLLHTEVILDLTASLAVPCPWEFHMGACIAALATFVRFPRQLKETEGSKKTVRPQELGLLSSKQ